MSDIVNQSNDDENGLGPCYAYGKNICHDIGAKYGIAIGIVPMP